jgi:hypothetical protein
LPSTGATRHDFKAQYLDRHGGRFGGRDGGAGGLREMHWHPNADEWQYWIKGSGRMTVFNSGPRAVTSPAVMPE